MLNESVERLNTILQITPSLAKVLLLEHQWNNQVIVDKYRENATALLVAARIKPPTASVTMMSTLIAPSTSAAAAKDLVLSSGAYKPVVSVAAATTSATTSAFSSSSSSTLYRSQMCPVCATSQLGEKFHSLSCGHSFCKDCWTMFFETQIFQVNSDFYTFGFIYTII